MALKFRATGVATDTTAKPITLTYVCGTGLNTMLIVGVSLQDSGSQPTATAATYNGISMTSAASKQGTNAGPGWFDEVSFWLLPAPTPGSHSISVSVTDAGVLGDYGFAVWEMQGCQQSITPDATGNSTGTATGAISTSITTVAPGAWVFGLLNTMNDGSTTGSITSSQNIRQGINLSTNVNGRLAAVDYDSSVPPGSNPVSYNYTGGTGFSTVLTSSVAMSLAPFTQADTHLPNTGARPHPFSPGLAR